MKQKLLAVVMVVVLVFVFTIGTLLAPLALLFRPGTTFRAMNRLCGAAWLGFSGQNTISKECGLRIKQAAAEGCRPCAFCRRLCALLNAGDPNHCTKEAV